MKEQIQFLKDLQATMNYENEHDYDSQASPRFWTIMDYRIVPTHEDYGMDRMSYYHNDGDHTELENVEELKEFLLDAEYELDDEDEMEEYKMLLEEEDTSFEDLWEFIDNTLNEDGFFNKVPVKEESFIRPDTMFLTKEEAKRHLELNHYHYTSKAHTYAMTAWRAPKVEKLLNILSTFNWDSIEVKEIEHV